MPVFTPEAFIEGLDMKNEPGRRFRFIRNRPRFFPQLKSIIKSMHDTAIIATVDDDNIEEDEIEYYAELVVDSVKSDSVGNPILILLLPVLVELAVEIIKKVIENRSK